MNNQEEILSKIILALQENEKDNIKATKEDDFEEQAFCKGYENAMCFVLSLYGISYDEAMNKKI